MHGNNANLLREVADYYAEKLAAHGDTPRGVDWNGEESQAIRFDQLCKVIAPERSTVSINDLGCGYGALLDYLGGRYSSTRYLGVDVSDEMIGAATKRNRDLPNARFITSAEPDEGADYGVASGIFN